MRKTLHFLLLFLATNCILLANDKETLTIWIRSFGHESSLSISSYLKEIIEELSSDFELRVFVATKPEDPVFRILEKDQCNDYLTILQTNLDSISQGLNALVDATSKDSYVLSISQGVGIHTPQVKEAFDYLKKGAFVYGWQLSNLQNDGSLPGKGWYHTACVYSPKSLTWLKEHPFPHWIDTGIDGFIVSEGQSIPIGGNEEIVVMGWLIQESPNAFFVHNVSDILHFKNQTGTGVTFEQKIKRKLLVANHYLKNRLHMDASDIWGNLILIK